MAEFSRNNVVRTFTLHVRTLQNLYRTLYQIFTKQYVVVRL